MDCFSIRPNKKAIRRGIAFYKLSGVLFLYSECEIYGHQAIVGAVFQGAGKITADITT
jgi:hypothetical protein